MPFYLLACYLLLFPWLSVSLLAHPGMLRESGALLLAGGLGMLALVQALTSRRKTSGLQTKQCAADSSQALPFLLLTLFLLWSALSWIWSTDRWATQLYLFRLLPWGALVLSTGYLLREESRRYAALFLLSLSLALAGGWAMIAVAEGRPVYAAGRAMLPFDHPGTLGGVMVFPLILLLVFAIPALRRRQRIGWGALGLAILCLGGLMASGTRSALLGVAVGLFVALLLHLRGAPRRFLLGLGLGGVVLTGLFLREHLGTVAGQEWLYSSSSATRLLFSQVALSMAWAHPIGGVGAGAFIQNSAAYQTPTMYLHAQRGDFLYCAHSEPMQILAELGFPGIFLCIVFLVALARQVWKARGGDILALGMIAALAGITTDACFSMSLRYHEMPWHWAIVLGILLAFCRPCQTSRNADASANVLTEPSMNVSVMIPALLVGCVFGGIPALYTLQSEIDLNEMLYDYQTTEKIRNAQSAAQCTSSPLTWLHAQSGLALAVEEQKRLPDALLVREKIQKHFPDDMISRKERARLLVTLGRPQDAFHVCLEGLRINPYSPYMTGWLSNILQTVSTIEQLDGWIGSTHPALDDNDCAYLRFTWYRLKRDQKNAELWLEQCMPQTVQIANATLGIAAWNMLNNRREDACALLEQQLTTPPYDPRAQAMLAMLYGGENDLPHQTEAFRLIEKSLQHGCTIPEIIRTASILYLSLGETWANQRAEDICRDAISKNPDNPNLVAQLLWLLKRLGREKEATTLYKTARRRFGKHPALQFYAPRPASSATPQPPDATF